mmetsp:Transcript_21599/g.47268  ORF Transcript_21599/g.47268 Transcript_21599/m.47268 type:complete len:111 (-) Transcript_21599:417-749(-)
MQPISNGTTIKLGHEDAVGRLLLAAPAHSLQIQRIHMQPAQHTAHGSRSGPDLLVLLDLLQQFHHCLGGSGCGGSTPCMCSMAPPSSQERLNASFTRSISLRAQVSQYKP